ncbi:unnamed protein product [Fusarium fujikuroi]|uniref:Fungal N-terminal domain-containing protein n=1 Tax=Fusarium fujikuroi TaxID=5127 RepID=A0A9Q9RG50_FUSFU|nr:unnamed protein product [Fusarium fujikuroi]
MEAVGTAASIAALAEIALKSFRAASCLVKDFYSAPSELSRLAQQLSILHCELSLLSDIQQKASQSDDLLLLPTEIDLLRQALNNANELLSNTIDALNNIQPHKYGPKARLQWALRSKSQAQDLLTGLVHVEAGLTNVLLLVNVRLSTFSCKLVASMRDSQKPVERQADNIFGPGPSIKENIHFRNTALFTLFDRNPQLQNSFYGSWRSWDTSILSWLGLQLILTMYGNSLHTTFLFSGKLSLWKSPQEKVVLFNIGLRIFPLAHMGFSILRGGLSVKTVIPDDSEIITACKRGDIYTVQRLFISRRSSPYDFETSPLEWAFRTRHIEIARFFLTQGASLDYLCYRGWTPAMLLFQKDFPEVPLEFFELLSCNSFTDMNVQDRYGATVLHRAALWGTEGDTNALLRLGASPLLMDTDVGWTPAFGAASMNNTAVLKRLAEVMPPDFVHHIDFRGRTILHIAIESGGLEAIVFALEMGVDPHQPSRILVDGGGASIEITPYEFANSKGSDIYEVFIRALQMVGHSISTVEEVEGGFMFWDTVERKST